MVTNGGRIRIFSLVTLLFVGMAMTVAGQGGRGAFCDKIKPCQLLTKSDAEKILGQPARLTQDVSQLKGDVRQCMCAYSGASTDQSTGQGSVLFFALEEKEANASAEQAEQVLVSTKEANEHDTEVLDLKGIGDEAFLLSNDSNSHLIMARKGAIIMRLQVKRAAGPKSQENIKAFAEGVFKRL